MRSKKLIGIALPYAAKRAAKTECFVEREDRENAQQENTISGQDSKQSRSRSFQAGRYK